MFPRPALASLLLLLPTLASAQQTSPAAVLVNLTVYYNTFNSSYLAAGYRLPITGLTRGPTHGVVNIRRCSSRPRRPGSR